MVLEAYLLLKFLWRLLIFTMSQSLLTIGQSMGVTFLILALIAWRAADLAKDAQPAFGHLYAITQEMWTPITVTIWQLLPLVDRPQILICL